jgi:DNA-binding transcriptional LysR family regulator
MSIAGDTNQAYFDHSLSPTNDKGSSPPARSLMPRSQKNLPPLTWLRAFEATGRQLSMARAAEELGITPSAISQQIKSLEAYLGCQLLLRRPAGLRLADGGVVLLPKLSTAFRLLREAADDVQPGRGRLNLKVRVPTSFASQWLIHRLDSFRRSYPEVAVQLSATSEPIEASGAGVDVEIRYGDGDWPGLAARQFLREEIFPVCSPALLRGRGRLVSPRDVVRFEILDVPGYPEGWAEWLAEAGLTLDWTDRRLVFDQSVMAIQAAVDGKGVAMGRSTLVAHELAAGRLVAPFALRLPTRGGYWVLHRARRAVPRKVTLFVQWLIDAAERSGVPARARHARSARRLG